MTSASVTRHSTRGRRSARALLALVSVALLTACGSTVALTTSTAGVPADGGLGPGTSGDPVLGSPEAPGAGPLAPGSAPGAVPGQRPAGSSPGALAPTSGAGGSVGSQRPGAAAANVPGMTATTVKIGVERVDTAALGAFASSTGTDASIGDLNAYQDALISWVNTNGGLAGRTLTPVFFQAQISAGNQQNNSARCATWAEDERVFAAQASYYQGGGAVPCLAERGVISVSTFEVAPGSADDFNRYRGRYYAPGAMETVSLARSYATGLQEARFFTPSSKIGLLYFDFPEYRIAKERGLKPTLARFGLSVASEYAVAYGGNASELGSITAAVQSAGLQFASEGIKDVLFLDSGGTLALFFMQNAQNQRQTFRYGLNSTSDAGYLEGQSNLAPELARAVIAGQQPGRDLNDVSSAPRNPDRDRCLAILKKAGHTITSSVDRKAVLGYCAFYFLLKGAFDRAASYDPAGFAKAVAALGASPGTAAASHGDDFALGNPWGAARYAIARWRTECSCLRYDGPARRF